jgi:hypothetical protein
MAMRQPSPLFPTVPSQSQVPGVDPQPPLCGHQPVDSPPMTPSQFL